MKQERGSAMQYPQLRAELRDFYENKANDLAATFYAHTTPLLDEAYEKGMSVYAQKALQYRVIAAECRPILFAHSPFYYEMGTLAAHCDGARDFRGHSHAGGWVFRRNYHYFKETNPALYQKKKAQANELLYLICGVFNDMSQHFCFNHRPILESGFRGVYERAEAELKHAQNENERDYLQATMQGALAVKQMAEKFAQAAKRCEKTAKTAEERARYARIAESAARCPWEGAQSFYEALNTLAFCRKALGTLEGVGFSSFGRVDKDLYPYYKRDIERGTLTQEDAEALIRQFLITFDMHYDHDMKMVGYADHELENTYVLGGCDDEGKPLYNDLSEMFLRAAREEKIIYPKIKARYSKSSPKAYLDEIDRAVIAGTSTVLYQNDDATVPALLRAGRTLTEARDYIISGCWDIASAGVEKSDSGNYVNLLKPFEFSLHRREDKMAEVGLHFAPVDGAKCFEDVYRITLENIRTLFEERASITREGGQIWEKVDALPLYSCTLSDCIKKRRDFIAGGARYRDDRYYCFGLPNLTDSLLAIDQLCFKDKLCSLDGLLTAVRENWQGYEDLRLAALRAPGWGDGSKASTALAARLNHDLCRLADGIEGGYGGKILLGHLTYTEIRFWGEQTLATPDGRFSGDYFSQGLTPSRLKKIPAVTSVIGALSALDGAEMGGNSVVNIILPSNNVDLDRCEAFLRAAAGTAMQSLQLNCTTREQLLDAQKHPEKYPDLIVRVCGFSAKFTSLSPEWQKEVLTRNFYE
jgi:formate C-acetyltransferase